MAILKKSTFSFVLLALISPSAYGDISFQQCKYGNDNLTPKLVRENGNGSGFDNNRAGSERTTYQNLCAGTGEFTQLVTTSTNEDVDHRNGHQFARFCDLIDRWESVQNLMFRGHSPHTVFAPTDAAFSKVNGLIDRVNELRLLELHILPQARLVQDLRCGQTYRTINTLQDRRNNQRSKTRCVNAARSQQLGPGNTVNGLRPTIGVPNNIFNTDEFSAQDEFVVTVNRDAGSGDNDFRTFSQDVIACNGVIHVVDEVLLPGNINDFSVGPLPGSAIAYGAYGGYGGYGGIYYADEPHNHNYQSYYNTAGIVSYGYYNGGVSYYYRGGKGFKGGRGRGRGKSGGRGYKGGKAFYGPRRPRPYNYYFRNLKGQEKGSEEMAMSDAEFFGVDGMADIEAKIESVKDEFSEKPDENRKRRLEAMLEADGSVKV